MNKRLFAVSVLLSAIPVLAMAGSINLSKGDFLSAKKITKNGEIVLSLKLSKSGKAKFKEWNKSSVGHTIHTDIAGVVTDFTLRDPIGGDKLEAGPYSEPDAQKVIAEINEK